MMATMQVAYLGLFILNNSDPLMDSLYTLKYMNGFNIVLNKLQQKEPNRIFAVGSAGTVFNNLNVMLLVILIPCILSLVFYIIHLKSTKWRIKMEKLWKQMIGEGILTALLFSLYNFSSSLGVFL